MPEHKKIISRRQFLRRSAAIAAFTIVPRSVLGGKGHISPSERINIACIGTGVHGIVDINAFIKNADVQIVAVCDVNTGSSDYRIGATAGREPARRIVESYYAKKKSAAGYKGCAAYIDFREMLQNHKDIDAVVIATPDHLHAVAAMTAIKMGKHVYCQKPLAHDIFEVRKLTQAARRYNVVTQMGIQNHASSGLKSQVELLTSGVIGKVHEIHLWAESPHWPQGVKRPAETPEVPKSLNWDLWIGPAPYRPYHPAYHPRRWRGWYDFGGGALGDMGCHVFDAAFWALKLGYPTKIEAVSSYYKDYLGKKVINTETYPRASIVRYHFSARGDMPPVKLTWYDGGLKPARPDELADNEDLPMTGGLYIGERGKTLAGFAKTPKLLGPPKVKNCKLPEPYLPRDVDHYQDWIRACKGGPKPLANFDYSGPLAEVVLQGCIAVRTGKLLAWDGPNMKVTNHPEANKYIHQNYRKGWSL